MGFFFATMQNFTPKKKGVHLSICAFVRGLKNIQKKGHMKTIVGVCVFPDLRS